VKNPSDGALDPDECLDLNINSSPGNSTLYVDKFRIKFKKKMEPIHLI